MEKNVCEFKNAKGEIKKVNYEFCNGRSARIKIEDKLNGMVWYFPTYDNGYNFLQYVISNSMSISTGNPGGVRTLIYMYAKIGNKWEEMEYKYNIFDNARKVFTKLIYDWTFIPATFHQFMDFIDDEADNPDSYWLQGAKGLKNVYDWYWCGGCHHSNNWEGFSEFFSNKILDVIPEIIKDVMKDNGIEKGDDDGKEIEIDFYEYGLSNRLYNDDINFDVVRYVYETNTDLFNIMLSEMLNDMGYHNIKFKVKF